MPANKKSRFVMPDGRNLIVAAPLIGASERAPDGVENVMVFRTGESWTMICREGLGEQHSALVTSTDLRTWKLDGPEWRMILMGKTPCSTRRLAC